MEKDEQGKADEGTSTSTQPPPDTTTTSTQPPLTTTTQAHVLTSLTSTIPITTLVSTPTDTFVTTSVMSPPLIQVIIITIERVTIHNIESNSDREDEQSIIQLAQRKVEKKKRKKIVQLGKHSKVPEQEQVDPMDVDEKNLSEKKPAKGEKEQDETDDEHDERLVLTPEDQEILLKEIAARGGLKEID
ncbi:uncharacterized protein LOC131051684 [Cryptomeria japonica]|uniref:uncharacterized protein LOC131051684 n=1 Tax=Cryptomeria japonica TaxID=3369 RepID=UPI0027DA7822|nr:uncharacterized protein LOC131051684 [Cryptomeria japonica]